VELGNRMVAKVIAANNSGKPDELYMFVIIYTYIICGHMAMCVPVPRGGLV